MNTLEQYKIKSAWDVGLIPTSEKNRLQRQRSRARKRGYDATLTALEWYAVVAYFDGKCAYCGCETVLTDNHPHELTLDHWQPLASGGGLTAANVLPCCRCCNEAKDDYHPLVWLECEFGAVLGIAIWRDCVGWLNQFLR